jgi:hypothetical protein
MHFRELVGALLLDAGRALLETALDETRESVELYTDDARTDDAADGECDGEEATFDAEGDGRADEDGRAGDAEGLGTNEEVDDEGAIAEGLAAAEELGTTGLELGATGEATAASEELA